jgi:uncharacterized protein YuzE
VKVSIDTRTDIMTLLFKENAVVAESDEEKPGIILDFDADGELVSMEILDASRRITRADHVDVETIA